MGVRGVWYSRRMRASLAVPLVFCAALAGCAGSPAMRAAEEGRYPELQAELKAEVGAARMSNRAAADVAREVASREVRHADKESALARVREVRACGYELDDALAERMKTKDEAGAEAAETRLEDGHLDGGDVRHLASATDDAWRAVGVRGLTRSGDRDARQRALVDGSPRVRRGAIHAAELARDRADLAPLFERARLDPEPLVRTDAVRAIARITTPEDASAAEVTDHLRDLWPTADEPLREDIAVAWASPAIFPSGGREALRMLLAAGKGGGVLAAAAAVLRMGPHDEELRASAMAVLVRAVESGSRRHRLHAIAVVPLGPPGKGESTVVTDSVLAALRKASHDEEGAVRVGALARLTESKADRDEAIHALEDLAARPDDRPEVASRARVALAAAGDHRVQAWLEADVAASDPQVRLSAVTSLAMLGVAGRGAPVLGDADASVRTRAACAVLLAVRGGR